MPEAANYYVIENLRDGRHIHIRSLRPDDEAGLMTAIGRTSAESLFRRFFAIKRRFTKKELAFFVNIDFISHVALVGVVEEGGCAAIVGGARYIVGEPGRAEMAFAVIDEYQGRGISTRLMRHLAAIARSSGIRELVAEVLPDNTRMLKVFEASGFALKKHRAPESVHLVLSLV